VTWQLTALRRWSPQVSLHRKWSLNSVWVLYFSLKCLRRGRWLCSTYVRHWSFVSRWVFLSWYNESSWHSDTHTKAVEYTKLQVCCTSCYGCETWLLALREEHRPILFISRALGRMKVQEGISRELRKLRNEELHNIFCSLNIVKVRVSFDRFVRTFVLSTIFL